MLRVEVVRAAVIRVGLPRTIVSCNPDICGVVFHVVHRPCSYWFPDNAGRWLEREWLLVFPWCSRVLLLNVLLLDVMSVILEFRGWVSLLLLRGCWWSHCCLLWLVLWLNRSRLIWPSTFGSAVFEWMALIAAADFHSETLEPKSGLLWAYEIEPWFWNPGSGWACGDLALCACDPYCHGSQRFEGVSRVF